MHKFLFKLLITVHLRTFFKYFQLFCIKFIKTGTRDFLIASKNRCSARQLIGRRHSSSLWTL